MAPPPPPLKSKKMHLSISILICFSFLSQYYFRSGKRPRVIQKEVARTKKQAEPRKKTLHKTSAKVAGGIVKHIIGKKSTSLHTNLRFKCSKEQSNIFVKKKRTTQRTCSIYCSEITRDNFYIWREAYTTLSPPSDHCISLLASNAIYICVIIVEATSPKVSFGFSTALR